MSKSLGNQTFPQDVIKQSGADILRLWAASVDYSDDQRIGPEILKSVSDNYRKLRNSLRWMLGTLAHRPLGPLGEALPRAPLERLMLHRLAPARSDRAQGLRRLRLRQGRRGAGELHERRSVGVLLRHPQGRALLRRAVERDAARGARRRRAHLPVRHGVARADPRLHLRGGMGVARSHGRLGPSRAVPDRAGGMARRRARQALGRDPPRAFGRHRRAGEGARGEGDRLVARSAPARLRRRSGAEGRARRGRFRRSVHHLRSRPRLRRRRAGRRLPPGRRLRRRGRRRARAGRQMRALAGAISIRRPPTPTIPTSARATRRRCASSASSGGRDARRAPSAPSPSSPSSRSTARRRRSSSAISTRPRRRRRR